VQQTVRVVLVIEDSHPLDARIALGDGVGAIWANRDHPSVVYIDLEPAEGLASAYLAGRPVGLHSGLLIVAPRVSTLTVLVDTLVERIMLLGESTDQSATAESPPASSMPRNPMRIRALLASSKRLTETRRAQSGLIGTAPGAAFGEHTVD
jgi:hypothetical protein